MLFGTLLAVGNCLNAGKKLGQADGFNMDAIGKASMIKSSANVSIMEYCCQLCCDEDPEFRSIKKDFECVKLALKCIVDDVEKMVDKISTEIKICDNQFKTIKKADPDTEKQVFGEKILKFIPEAEEKRDALKAQFTEVKEDFAKAADWFMFVKSDEKRTKSDKFFKFFIEFIDTVDKSLPKP